MIKDKDMIKESDSGCSLGPLSNQKLQTFSFYRGYGQRKFEYDGFLDKITTHGRSHLSLLRESYQKII